MKGSFHRPVDYSTKILSPRIFIQWILYLLMLPTPPVTRPPAPDVSGRPSLPMPPSSCLYPKGHSNKMFTKTSIFFYKFQSRDNSPTWGTFDYLSGHWGPGRPSRGPSFSRDGPFGTRQVGDGTGGGPSGSGVEGGSTFRGRVRVLVAAPRHDDPRGREANHFPLVL